MPAFKELLRKLLYLKRSQLREVYKAYKIAASAHAGQKRDSGEAYISHPLTVASILASLHLDYESIVASILHDVVEDTTLTKEFILANFGPSIAALVDGVTKLEQIAFPSRAEAQAESFRKMVLAMAQDIRIILIKLADRLHNMQTLDGVAPEKRQRIARETLDIYAPLANRLGMHELSIELETLAFAYLYPNRHRILQDAVKKVRGNRREMMAEIENKFKEAFAERHLENVKIIGRAKHLYGIYKKMQRKHLSFSEIMDVYALRIIVDSIDDCYRALGIVHNVYKPIPGRIKDYIAIPKINGYQSLHTKLYGPSGIPIEVQIRTPTMDQMANSGIAAHWLYKSDNKMADAAQIRAQQWVNNLLEMQKNTGSSLEFVENVKIDLFPDEVYVFTPKGDILELPRGATVADLAYAIHTDIGNSCVAARIDKQFSALSTVLSNGQTVGVITAPGAKPNPAWLNFVVTAKARSSIRSFLKNQNRSKIIALGKELLDEALAEISITPTQITPEIFSKVLAALEFNNTDDLYESIGLGNRLAIFVAHQIAAVMKNQHIEIKTEKSEKHVPLLIKGAEAMAITFASCCSPIPHDTIVGYFNIGYGLEIHTEDCKELIKLRLGKEKLLPVQWAEDVKGDFRVGISVEMTNQRGALAQMAQAVSDAGSSIDDISMSDCNGGYCLVSMKVRVHNAEHLEHVLNGISALPIVVGAIRKR